MHACGDFLDSCGGLDAYTYVDAVRMHRSCRRYKPTSGPIILFAARFRTLKSVSNYLHVQGGMEVYEVSITQSIFVLGLYNFTHYNECYS